MSDSLINVLQCNAWIVYIFRIEQHQWALGALGADLLSILLNRAKGSSLWYMLMLHSWDTIYVGYDLLKTVIAISTLFSWLF